MIEKIGQKRVNAICYKNPFILNVNYKQSILGYIGRGFIDFRNRRILQTRFYIFIAMY